MREAPAPTEDSAAATGPELAAGAEPAPLSSLRRLGLASLRARLVLIIFMALLPAFVLLLAVAALERSRAESTAAAEQLAVARLLRTQYTGIISSTEQLLVWTSQFPEIRTGDAAACTQRLRDLFSALPDYRGASVANPDGTADCVASTASTAPTLTLQVSERPYFQRAVQTGKFAVGGLDVGSISRRPSLTFGLPVYDDQGRLLRVIGAGLNVDTLNTRLAGADFPEDAALLLTEADGAIILRSEQPQEYVGRTFNLDDLTAGPDAAPGAALGPTEGVGEVAGMDGVLRQYAWTAIALDGKPAFYVLVGYTEDRIYGGVSRTLLASLIGLTIISLVALAAAWLGAESMIVRRIERLVQVANRMREGDLQARTGMANDPGEFGQLATTLDSMAAALSDRIAENERLLAETKELNQGLEQRVNVRTQQLQTSNARLLASQAELRRLSQALMRATEQERERISRDIHDQVGQMITAIKMEMRTLRRRYQASLLGPEAASKPDPKPDPRVEAKLDDISALLDETVIVVRRISSDLRPGVLDDFGLAAAAAEQVQEFEKRTGIVCTFNAALQEELIPSTTATAAFRILQESLTNVARHAHADQVTVELQTAADTLLLSVRDNGRGVTAEEQATTRSLGLIGMRERAVQLGGALTLQGTPGQGTTVTLSLPLGDTPADAVPNHLPANSSPAPAPAAPADGPKSGQAGHTESGHTEEERPHG